ncbi:CopG family transcriptional regulator [Nocardioides terrigena]|uniref:CopG family transcriptional regulator n=1 Tax=Nocardioides terrigena TaxID=424797 RepID=UPI000D313813|nr:CopG family transcriptional regulator [Nocardioides terrigena]
MGKDDERVVGEIAEHDGVSPRESLVRPDSCASPGRLYETDVRELSAQARDRYDEVLRRLGE